MYIQDAQRYPADFHKAQISKIVAYLNATNPITLFAPSGFGKSKLLSFLAFNTKYRRHYRNIRNTIFVYTDATEIVTELRNHTIIQASTTPGQAVPQTKIVEDKIFQAVKLSTDMFRIVVEATTLTEFLDKLFRQNSHLRLFVIIDGAEQLFAPEFELARDMLKYLRDKYRNRLDYIFAISDAKYLDQVNYEQLGNIASLIGQKIISLPLEPSAESVHFTMYTGSALKYHLWEKRKPGLQEYLQQVDNITGGYVPYIKHFLLYGQANLHKFQLTKELQLASERLLLSLTPQQVVILENIALDHPSQPEVADYNLLAESGLIRKSGNKLQLFSPIMTSYLQWKAKKK